MSEWNLSVRLTGQGSGLSRTLRDLASDAQSASGEVNALRRNLTLLRAEASNNISIRLDVDADHLRADVNAALTTAGAGQGLRVRLDVDADHLRADVNAALTTAAAGQGLGVNLRLTDASQLRRDVANAVRWAAWGHRIDIPIGLADPMQLRRDVSAAVRWASMNQAITVRVTPDTSALNGLNNTINHNGGGSSGGKTDWGLKGLLTLAPAAIPLAAGLAHNLAPLAAQFLAAGAAGAAFTIALAGQIGPLKAAADAEKKYQDAVAQHGARSKEAIQAEHAYQLAIQQLPPATQKAAAALSSLKSDFSDWSNELSRFTMTPLTRGLQVLDQIFPHLTPEVVTASDQLNRLVTIAGGAIRTPGFDALSDKFAAFTTRELTQLTDGVIHVMRVLSEGGSFNGPLAQFIAYARQNGPAAREALTAIADAAGVLAQGAAEAGPGMLTLVTAAVKLVAALPPELVTVILQVAAALKLMSLAGMAAGAVGGQITRLGARITALQTVAAGAGGGIAGLGAALNSLSTKAKIGLSVAAIGALVLALHELSDNKPAIEVDALSTSLNTLLSTGKVTGALKSNFSEISDSIAMVSKGASDNKLAQMTSDFGTWIGIAKGPGISTAKKNVDAWDKSMAQLVRAGHPKEAAAQYDLLKKAWVAGGGDLGRLKKFTDDYNNALADQKFEAQMAAESMGLFGEAAQKTQAKLDAQKASADGLRQSVIALNQVNRDAGGAMNAFEQAIDDASKAAKDNAGALKMNHGELDQGTEKARNAESALRTLAANTEDAATKAREQGKSWEYVQGIMKRGQDQFVTTAQKMGLTKTQAEALAQSYLDIPASKTTLVQMRTEDAITGLQSVMDAITKTPNKKSVTVDALTSDAVGILKDLGFKVTHLENGQFKVTADTATAKARLADVQAARDGLKDKSFSLTARDHASAQAAAIKRAIDNIRDKTVTLTTVRHTINVEATAGRAGKNLSGFARGGIVDHYAHGGIRFYAGGGSEQGDKPNQHMAQITAAGSYRVWGERETQGEGYVPFRRSARPRSRAITEEIVRRLGGDPRGIQWNAAGSVTDWRYDPTSGSLYSASDAGQAGHKTKKVKVKGKTKEVNYFDIGAVEKKLKSASKATTAWNKDLEKVADRVGGDVADALAAMGEDGAKLAHKMATGSTKYINDMAAALRNLQKTAKASLTDYTRQLTSANKLNKAFSDNLATLAARGYGDLASQLAAQNDTAAQQLAAAAVGDSKKASSANAQAKAANSALTGDQVAELVQIIAAISTSRTGIHDVAGKTGLGEDEIIAVATKAKAQISSSLGSRAGKFLTDLGRAGQHLSYANGGIRAGMYATRGGIVNFAEPSTGGEAYLPLSASKRRHAMPVLADVAHRFGVGLTDASSGRQVVIVQGGDTLNVSVPTIRTGASASDIGAQVGRSYRRAKRGGVASRAA